MYTFYCILFLVPKITTTQSTAHNTPNDTKYILTH